MKRSHLVPIITIILGIVFLVSAFIVDDFLSLLKQATTTKASISTIDNQSNYERCASSGYKVVYLLYGSATKASITWINQTNGMQQGEWGVPFCYAYDGFQSGNVASIVAQIQSSGGDLTCEILSNDQTIAKAHSTGFASLATCYSGIP